jgi:hypothetical protein
MKTTALLSLVMFACTAAGRLGAQPVLRWSQGDPSGEEQQAMEWLNAARGDPPGTLAGILSLSGSDPVIGGFLLAGSPVTADQLGSEIQAAWAQALADSTAFPTSEAVSRAPLAFYPLFQQQAGSWGATASPPSLVFPPQRPPPTYVYPVPLFGPGLLSGPGNVFSGPDATGGTASFGPIGTNFASVSQASLYAPYIGAREWMLTQLTGSLGSWSPPPGFLVQGDSLPNLSLGHTRMAGISICPTQGTGRTLTFFRASSEFLSSSDLPFGGAGTVFITGVAYRDANSNGAYEPGEGLAGITITPDRGAWYAVTSASGGYAIPVPANSGVYRLTASGAPLDGAVSSAAIGADSVKVDWVLPAAAAVLPPQVSVPSPDGSARLAGLSTRGLVQAGDQALVGGFVIAGPPGARKRLLIRGVGPSLRTAGFPAASCIPSTQLQVFDGGGVIVASNAGWTSVADGGAATAAAAAQVGDFPLTAWAGGGGDSALVATLAPGPYTAIVAPSPGIPAAYQSGYFGLVEIYDLNPSDGSRLVNLSTRGLAGAGAAGLIAGCTIAGTGHDRLLVRGDGPGTARLGLTGVLPNPVVTLYDSSGNPVAFNDDWGNSPQATQVRSLAAACGAFALPEGGLDASLVVLEGPGSYTAIVGPREGTGQSGLALVELYEAP